MRDGLTFQGGLNTGKTVVDTCPVRSELPEQRRRNPLSTNDPGFVTRVTGLGSYTVPKIDVLVSGTFRRDQGSPLTANYVVTTAEAAKTLGRPLSGNAPSVTVNLLKPGEMWGNRVNEVDLKVARDLSGSAGRGPTWDSTSTTCSTRIRC